MKRSIISKVICGPNGTAKRRKTFHTPQHLKEYHHDGYRYTLIRREGKIGLYEQRNCLGAVVAYELIQIQSNARKEYPPKSEDWGRLGYSYISLPSALSAFEQIVTELNRNRQ